MYKLNVTTSFSGAHNLKGYPGECKYLHGHNWKVRVQLVAEKTDELGMAIDFRIVKELMNDLIGKFDHKYINDLEWFKVQNPTSENIAKVIFDELHKAFENKNVSLDEVEIWESDFTSIIYNGK